MGGQPGKEKEKEKEKKKGEGEGMKGRRGEGAFGCFYACHYADCDHEIEVVESGYRVVVVRIFIYNISKYLYYIDLCIFCVIID